MHADDVKLSFYMCLVKLNPSTYMDMMGLLSKSAALFPFVRTEMRQYPLNNGATYKEINNPFNNKVPQRFVLAIVENSAFNGRYDQDTFAYQLAGIEYIKQIGPLVAMDQRTFGSHDCPWSPSTTRWMGYKKDC